ncbi:CoA-binding protein [Halostagnicola kamekurae]|uniref:acetate--CoA ligase (ADP-forming) n=1 Tax=Halostagnicola kamekurae TaxID=619731 RepID=A0A1I6TK72_9EURY|nr:CoA-binding protein [Halostagnicola kamekurae]SFS89554.1 Acyl-CoA synthetase (NDP forming) [Halostagnicola kamekurae]
MSLSHLFDPDGIAVIGASKTPGKLGNDAMTNIESYDGDVYPVNPSSSGTVYGYEFVDSVHDVEADLALCCVPGPVLPEVIEECGEAGIGAAVIFAGGFAEVDADGEQLERTITDLADEYDITLLGPNTAGYILPDLDLYGSFVPRIREVESGNVGILAQSGGVGVTASFQLEREGYGVSAMFGLGNRANTGFAELIPELDADPNTDAIALHIEGTEDFEGFLEACENAETPIVAFKVGESDVGEFVQSHTAAPDHDNETYERALSTRGVTMVSSLTELIDASRALADSPVPDGQNVGVVTAQAGPGIIVADALKQEGIEFPDLTDATQETVDDLLQGITYTENPVDTGRPMPEFGEVVEAVARDENVDIVIVYEIYEDSLGYPVEELESLTDDIDKPVLFTIAGPNHALEEERRAMEDIGVPTFQSPQRGADAVAALVDSISEEREESDLSVTSSQ